MYVYVGLCVNQLNNNKNASEIDELFNQRQMLKSLLSIYLSIYLPILVVNATVNNNKDAIKKDASQSNFYVL